jgi:hypothetical protein
MRMTKRNKFDVERKRSNEPILVQGPGQSLDRRKRKTSMTKTGNYSKKIWALNSKRKENESVWSRVPKMGIVMLPKVANG